MPHGVGLITSNLTLIYQLTIWKIQFFIHYYLSLWQSIA
jgi:hypothetical protein